MKKTVALGSVLFSLLLWSCGGDNSSPTASTPTPTPVATSITLSATSLSFTSVGATFPLSSTVKDQNGATMSGATVTWATSDASVATVSSTGLVTAVANGTETITATSGSASDTASVTVAIPAIAVMVSDSTASSITVGNQLTLPVVVDMSQAPGLNIASLQVKVTWNASIVSYVSATPGTLGALTTNETDVATGTFLANLFSGTGTEESFRALVLTFSGASGGTTAVEVEVTTAGNELGQSVLDKVTTRKHDVTVSN
jgi:hypothetical protein